MDFVISLTWIAIGGLIGVIVYFLFPLSMKLPDIYRRKRGDLPMAEKEFTRDERIKHLEDMLNDLEQELTVEHNNKMRLYGQNQALEQELKSVRREETEADLLYASLKIVMEILSGKKKEEIELLIAQQHAMAAQRGMLNVAGHRLVDGGVLGGLDGIINPQAY